jgi:hypothetical protein
MLPEGDAARYQDHETGTDNPHTGLAPPEDNSLSRADSLHSLNFDTPHDSKVHAKQKEKALHEGGLSLVLGGTVIFFLLMAMVASPKIGLHL